MDMTDALRREAKRVEPLTPEERQVVENDADRLAVLSVATSSDAELLARVAAFLKRILNQ
jgi:hypothetical protein